MYQNKYLKYKNKYLNLKKQIGGITDAEKRILYDTNSLYRKLMDLKTFPQKLYEGIKVFTQRPKLYESDFDNFVSDCENPEIFTLLNGLKNSSSFYPYVYKNVEPNIMRSRELANQSKQLLYDYIVDRFNDIITTDNMQYFRNNVSVGFTVGTKCSIPEMMTMSKDDLEKCRQIDLNHVIGSCKEPGFIDNNIDIDVDTKNKWLEMLSIINRNIGTLNPSKKITIIIGAYFDKSYFTNLPEPSTYIDSESFTLFVNPKSLRDPGASAEQRGTARELSYNDFLTCKLELERSASLVNKQIYWKTYFPLSHNFENSLLVLNKLLEIKDRLRIVNRMCGSCHRSLYYLVNNGVEYIVEPEQGLSHADTEEITRCFRK
jgi:hypothetical protein